MDPNFDVGKSLVDSFLVNYHSLVMEVSFYLQIVYDVLRLRGVRVFEQFVAAGLVVALLGLLAMGLMFVLTLGFRGLIKLWKALSYLYSYFRAKSYVEEFDPQTIPVPAVGTLYRSIDSGLIKDSHGNVVDVVAVQDSFFNKNVALEMSMDNSTFTSSGERTTQTIGLMAVRNSSGGLIGMSSCIDYKTHGPVLMTAAHVWRHVIQSGAGMLEHKGKKYNINPTWKPLLLSGEKSLDLVIIAVPHLVFAALGVKKLQTARLVSRSRISIHGYNAAGNFGCSLGTAEHVPGRAFRLRHYASTIPGASGSPVIHLSKVVGIHTSANVQDRHNLGSVLFWLEFSSTESDKKLNPNDFTFVDDLPDGIEHSMFYREEDKRYQIQQVGRAVRVKETPHVFRDADWFYNDDEMDYSMPLVFESVDFPQGKVVSPIQQPPALVQNLEPSKAPVSLQTVKPFNGSTVSGATKKKRKNRKKRELDSKKLEPAPTDPSVVVLEKIQSLIKGHVKSERVLQSGPFHPEDPVQNEGASSSRPQDITVQVVAMSRRQERLYNRICHDRRFQRALRARTPEEAVCLRKATLDFVVFSKTVSTEQQVQDFLSFL